MDNREKIRQAKNVVSAIDHHANLIIQGKTSSEIGSAYVITAQCGILSAMLNSYLLSAEQECKTCGGTGQVGEEESCPITGKSVGFKECPDCSPKQDDGFVK